MVALPHSRWEAQPTQLATTDKITVRNLQATVNAGVDVWGRVKSQRALISVTLSLAKPFESAAETDVVDNSTVHYGKLSKDIQACIQDFAANSDAENRKTTSDLMLAIHEQIRQKTVPDNKLLGAVEVDIFYPKGSMLGDGAGYTLGHSLASSDVYTQLYLRNVRVPCLIGVNSNERLQKQPVVINLWIEPVSVARSEDYPKLESAVVEVRQGLMMNRVNRANDDRGCFQFLIRDARIPDYHHCTATWAHVHRQDRRERQGVHKTPNRKATRSTCGGCALHRDL